jgi:hypothetical protein
MSGFLNRAKGDSKSKGWGAIKLAGHRKNEIYIMGDPRDFAITTPCTSSIP